MHGELRGLHIDGITGQSACHHDPSYCPLECTKKKENDERLDHVIPKPALNKENDEGYKKHNTYEPAPKPVKPFPEKNRFEIREWKIKIDQVVLGRLLIFMKFFQPLCMIKRRKCPGDQVPFGNGKT